MRNYTAIIVTPYSPLHLFTAATTQGSSPASTASEAEQPSHGGHVDAVVVVDDDDDDDEDDDENVYISTQYYSQVDENEID